MLLRRWAGSVLRSRNRSNRGSVRTLQELRRMAILEAAAEKPAHTRATSPFMSSTSSSSSSSSLSPLAVSSGAAAALQSLDEAIEATCDGFTTTGGRPRSTASSRMSSAPKVASLSQFMSECCRLRRDIGECRDMENRRLLRETLRRFWAENVDGALTCCALRGRDFGFIAGFGLIDDRLHVRPDSLELAHHSLLQEKSTCSCMDMMLALHYMARELDHLERKRLRETPAHHSDRWTGEEKTTQSGLLATSGAGGGRDHTSVNAATRAREDLSALRQKIATLGLERIHFFFLQRASSGRVLGSAEDALHALEFLAIVKVSDADESARVLVASRRGVRSTTLDNRHIVTSLFRHASSNNKDLKFTSIIHAFRLLRIFLPVFRPVTTLSSPQKISSPWSRHRKGNAESSTAPPPTVPITDSDADAAPAAAAAPEPSPDQDHDHEALPLVDMSLKNSEQQGQHDAMNHIVWGFCVAIQRRDARFVNPFHFVQVMETISRLPPYVLSRVPRPKRQRVENLETLAVFTGSSTAPPVRQVSSPGDGRTPQTVEGMWEYMVSKACIFIPSLPPSQRRRACCNLRLAVMKRANSFTCPHSGDRRWSSDLSVAEQLLLPMAHELSQYPKDYQAAMLDCQTPEETAPATRRKAMRTTTPP